ncbi:MAG: glutaredoxin 3 [Pseudomonadota bacterium]
MKKVLVYSTRVCPFCVMAKRLLSSKGVSYEDVAVDADEAKRAEMMQRSGGRRTVPQIFIGEQHVGGFQELSALEHQGQLDPLLADKPNG